MKTLPAALLSLTLIIIAVSGWRLRTLADDQVQQIPDIVVDEESPRVLGPLKMQAKLAESQDVLEGLLNRDFSTVRNSAKVLTQLAELGPPPGDEQLEDRIYEHFRTEFIRLSNELKTMADERNLEGAAYVHQNLTATCIACHAHLRDKTLK